MMSDAINVSKGTFSSLLIPAVPHNQSNYLVFFAFDGTASFSILHRKNNLHIEDSHSSNLLSGSRNRNRSLQ